MKAFLAMLLWEFIGVCITLSVVIFTVVIPQSQKIESLSAELKKTDKSRLECQEELIDCEQMEEEWNSRLDQCESVLRDSIFDVVQEANRIKDGKVRR